VRLCVTGGGWSRDSDICISFAYVCKIAGVYSLSVLDVQPNSEPTVKHYRIRNLQDGGCCISPRKLFASMEQLVEHYSRQSMQLLCISTDLQIQSHMCFLTSAAISLLVVNAKLLYIRFCTILFQKNQVLIEFGYSFHCF